MKLAVMPKEPTWWVWLVTVVLLALGLAGVTAGFIAAIVLTSLQVLFFWKQLCRVSAIGVQIRLGYTLLLLVCFTPSLRWLYWLPTVGTVALLVFGYCLMARTLSLLPWNRSEQLTLNLLRRTFLTAPVVARGSMESSACGGEDGICELEARAAMPRPAQSNLSRQTQTQQST